MVSSVRGKLVDIVADHPAVTHTAVHAGGCDIVKEQSEVLTRDFIDSLNTVSSVKVFTRGRLPPGGGGDERFSRLSTA